MKQQTPHVCGLSSISQDYIFLNYKKKSTLYVVLRNTWLKMILISMKNTRSRIFFRSNASIYFERKRHIESKHLYTIHPFSIFRLSWDCVMIVVFILCLIMLPLNIAHNLQDVATQATMAPTHAVLLVCDLFCLNDILVNCFTGYENFSSKEVYLAPRKIFRYYFASGNFILDLITSMPFQITRYITGLTPTARLIITLLSLLKGFRARTLFKYCKRLPTNWHINSILFKLLLYVFMSLFTLHWAACIFLIVPKLQYFIYDEAKSWMDIEHMRHGTTFEQYNFAIFAATASFLCVRYTTNEIQSFSDTIMFTITYVLGYIMCILLFVILLQMVLSYNTPATKYESIMNQLNQYMRHRQLPLNLQHRLVQYYGHRFRKTYFRESAIMPILSERLQLEINLHCYTTLVENVTILHELPDEMVSEIVSNLKSEVFLPNDIIIKAGTTGDSMYFIASGTVAVSTPTGKEVCHLQDGAYFGEVALIRKDQKRIANVVAIEICEVYKLDRKVFKICFATQPEVLKKLEKIAQDRYNRTNFLEELHKKHILERSLARKHEMGD